MQTFEKNRRTLFCVMALLIGSVTASVSDAQVLDKKQMIESVKSSVVNISVNGNVEQSFRMQTTFLSLLLADYLEQPETQGRNRIQYKGEGTGIVIDASGLILTNAHVVSVFDAIEVQTIDGKHFRATLINKDEKNDLALIKVVGEYKWKPIEMADSAAIKTGESVYAIGNPFSYSYTVTEGIVSAIGRKVEVDSEHSFEDMVQTTADINPGNSGGPLVDQSGRMFGVMTLSDRRARGINFAISVDTIRKLLPKLKMPPTESPEYAEFKRKFGFSIRELKKDGEQKIVISEIGLNSKAYKSGLRKDDVVCEFKKTDTRTLNDLLSAVRDFKPNEIAYIQIKRNERMLFTYVEAK